MPAIDEDAELDRLYAAPLEDFVPLRNDLARRFRQEGERAIATRIGELKKPTVSAWIVNQLARTREVDVRRLLKAGEALEEAQREALAGGGADRLQKARREEEAALRRLRDAAAELLPATSTATVDRVVRTLGAAAVSSDGRSRLKEARLAEDLEPPGFEALAGMAAGAATKRASTKKGSTSAPRREEKRRKQLRTARAEAKKAAEEAAELEHEARRATEQAQRAEKAAAAARKRAEAAAEKARRLEAELEPS